MTAVRSHGAERHHKPKKAEAKKDQHKPKAVEQKKPEQSKSKPHESKSSGLVDSANKLDEAIANTPEPKAKVEASAVSTPSGSKATAEASSNKGKDKATAQASTDNPFGTASSMATTSNSDGSSTVAMSSTHNGTASSMAVTNGPNGSTDVAMSTAGNGTASSMAVTTNPNGQSNVAMSTAGNGTASSMAVSTDLNGQSSVAMASAGQTDSAAVAETSVTNPFEKPHHKPHHKPESSSVAAASSCSNETQISGSYSIAIAYSSSASSSCPPTPVSSSGSVAVAASGSCSHSSGSVAVAASGTSKPHNSGSLAGSVNVLKEGKGAWGDPHFELTVDKNGNGKLDKGEKTSFDHKGKSGNTYQIFKTDSMDIKAKYEDTNNPNAPQVMGEVSINDKFKITKDGKLMSMDGKPITLAQARQLGLNIEKTDGGYIIRGANGSGDMMIRCNGNCVDLDPQGQFNNASGILGEALSMFAGGGDPASKGNNYWNKYDLGQML